MIYHKYLDTLSVIEKVRSVGAIFNAKESEESKKIAAEAGLSLTSSLSTTGARRLKSGDLRVLVDKQANKYSY